MYKKQLISISVLFFLALTGCNNNKKEEVMATASNAEALLGVTQATGEEEQYISYNGISGAIVNNNAIIYADSAIAGSDNNYPASSDGFIHFVNVGASSFCIAIDGSSGVIIDTGSADYENKVLGYIDRLNLTHLDIVLTEASKFRGGNMVAILDKFHDKIGSIIMPQFGSRSEEPVRTIAQTIEKYGLKVSFPEDGRDFLIDGFNGTVYYPYANLPDTTEESCISFKLNIGMRSFLFLSDMTGLQEEAVVKSHEAVACDVIISAGGNGGTNCSDALMRAVQPGLCCYCSSGSVSAGVKNRLADYGCGLINLNEDGTVVFIVDNTKMSINKGIVDYDTGENYTEAETTSVEFKDITVYCDDMYYHQKYSCQYMAEEIFDAKPLSEAIADGLSMCPYCSDRHILNGYDGTTVSEKETEETEEETEDRGHIVEKKEK